jgi:hypothetical protein
MLLEMKLKKAAMLAALDITLARMQKSPERCARNLLELGLTTYPGRLNKEQQYEMYQLLLELCKKGDTAGTRDIFLAGFLH